MAGRCKKIRNGFPEKVVFKLRSDGYPPGKGKSKDLGAGRHTMVLRALEIGVAKARRTKERTKPGRNGVRLTGSGITFPDLASWSHSYIS